MTELNFSNAEIVLMFKKLKQSKTELDACLNDKTLLKTGSKNNSFQYEIVPITESAVEKIKESDHYKILDGLTNKLEKISSIILESDDEVKKMNI